MNHLIPRDSCLHIVSSAPHTIHGHSSSTAFDDESMHRESADDHIEIIRTIPLQEVSHESRHGTYSTHRFQRSQQNLNRVAGDCEANLFSIDLM